MREKEGREGGRGRVFQGKRKERGREGGGKVRKGEDKVRVMI